MKKNGKICFMTMIAFLFVFMLAGLKTEAATTTYRRNGKKYTYRNAYYNVYYNNKKVNTTKKLGVYINDNYMIPYSRTLCTAANGPKMQKTWVKASKKLTITFNGTQVVFYVNKKYCYVNGKRESLNTEPLYVTMYGTTMIYLPCKALARFMGMGYSYNKSTRRIDLTYIAAAKDPTKTTTTVSKTGLQATSFQAMSTSEFIKALAPVAQKDNKKSGVMASVTLAQAILESGWGKSTLAVKANNMFGMKISLSGNTWAGSAWDGISKYTIKTKETYNHKIVTITAAFRKYPEVLKSVNDHSAYLTGAKNGTKLRYTGLTATKDPIKQVKIIKAGGYATGDTYVSQLSTLISRYNLKQYDIK